MRIQKTVFGFNVNDILKRIKETTTIGGNSKRVVSLRTYTNTVAHFTVNETYDRLILISGTKTIGLVK